MEKKSDTLNAITNRLVITLITLLPLLSYGQSDSLLSMRWTNSINRTIGYPLIRSGIVFLNSETGAAFDALTGKKMSIGEAGVIERIRKNIKERYIIFRQLEKFVVVDLHQGKIINTFFHPNRLYDQPELTNSNMVYVNTQYKTFQARDIISSKVIWEFKSSTSFNSNYKVIDSRLLLCDKQNLYCLNAQTGTVNWQARIGEVVSNILVEGTSVYVAIAYKGIFTIDLNTGENKLLLNKMLQSFYTIVKEEQSLYFISADLIRFDLAQGRITWQSKSDKLLPDYLTVTSQCIIAYTSDYGGSGPMVFFDKKDGREIQRYTGWDTEDGFKIFKLQVFNNEILIGSEGSSLYAFDLKNK